MCLLNMIRGLITLFVLFATMVRATEPLAQAQSALLNGAAFLRSISAEGGYLWRYSTDLQLVAGENQANRTTMWLQPPGTPSVGMALLKAYKRTREQALLDHALAAGKALTEAQLPSGGWDYKYDFNEPTLQAAERFDFR